MDQLAARCGVSVDTVRFYQTKGLVPPPERAGRIGWYSDHHLERISRILDLKSKGFSLESINRLLSGDIDAADEALVEAIAGREPGTGEAEGGDAGGRDVWLSQADLASRTGLSEGLINAISEERLLSPVTVDGEVLYTRADAEVLTAGLALLEAGIPLDELLALAREQDDAVRHTAERAVDLFVAHVRSPIRASAASDSQASGRLADVFGDVLPATIALVTNHFRAALLHAAKTRLEGNLDAGGDVAGVGRAEEPAARSKVHRAKSVSR